MTIDRIIFCERHWSWLCGVGQGKCQSEAAVTDVNGDSSERDIRPLSDTPTATQRDGAAEVQPP